MDSIHLTDAQLVMLSAASRRTDRGIELPNPQGRRCSQSRRQARCRGGCRGGAGARLASRLAAAQTQHQQTASTKRDLRASVNRGSPAIAATSRPGAFTGPGVVAPRHATGPANTPSTGANPPVRTNAAVAPAIKPQSPPHTTPSHDEPKTAHTTHETTVNGNPGNSNQHTTIHDKPPPKPHEPTAQAPKPPPKPQAAVHRPPPQPNKKPEKKPNG